jgi:hypothetical protein
VHFPIAKQLPKQHDLGSGEAEFLRQASGMLIDGAHDAAQRNQDLVVYDGLDFHIGSRRCNKTTQ